ncbi:hypothetical protein IEQ34_023231 [Dendrobium chrysotoxum]|uniref:Maturase K n=2 Tax=Dendrobium chrysotoxum TaxID=161865 RepID=A0AAV7FJN9_DENCH|nr:hypothetical protein IEQ34_026153 [Dendrobium chrysotoxum]KAH0439332.1 hypothetical protein IEQ34_025925 [Dendrobium chrysotoxum]KAH0439586.1 hypothetical protein IEQ34_025869 [Dendrobium chrysotoxum]KAH0440387.1 hypothetical protein IEQ34_025629 [Dendrobium chrysotoxum]KAH0446061.1 hypothetical protein IEQ34_025107 [Dendrobium chrysotoxum]
MYFNGRITRIFRLKKSRFRQQNFLYPLLLKEYIYSLAHYHSFNSLIFYEPVEILGYEKKSSLVLVKRLITRMYQQKSLISSDSNQNEFWGHKNSFSSQMKTKISEFTIYSFNIYIFYEKFSHFNYVSDLLIPHPIHLEILVKILQCWIKDVPSLHFLRLFFHEYHNLNSLITSKKSIYVFSKRKKRFFWFLHNSNSYVYECEYIFLFLRKQSSYLRSISSGVFLERTHFYGKREYLLVVCCNSFQRILWFLKDTFIHYVRYQGKAILASKGTLILMKKWKFHLVNFWQSYFHFWFQPYRIHIKQLPNYSFSFLGFFSSVLKNPLVVRNQMLENSFLRNTLTKKLDTIAPVISLIGSLSSILYCIGKPIWTDSDILDRFCRICRNLCRYHSGSSKKQVLYRRKYILRLSCARTLARKHKRKVQYALLCEEEKSLSLIFLQKIPFLLHGLHRERIWYLDIIRINDLVDHS